MPLRSIVSLCALCCLSAVSVPSVGADERTMSLADGKLVLVAPEGWKRKQPKINFIDFECEVPAVGDDKAPGRMTIMGAGGSVEDNVNRWLAQFEEKEKSDRKELTIAGQTIHYVDLAGTFKDQPGPFAPAVNRANYRMLAAIIVTEKAGKYFVKFYGPKETVAANEDAFKKMLDGLKVAEGK